jgi:hypothetical protein
VEDLGIMVYEAMVLGCKGITLPDALSGMSTMLWRS